MLKAIVIDDEPMALEVIRGLTEKVVYVELTAYFTNAFEAMTFLQATRVDLIFLDIEMPDITGIELLKTMPDPPMVIFTTAYSEHAVEGFELNAIDYLLKPFSLARFLKACNKAYEQYELKKNRPGTDHSSSLIFLKSGREQVQVVFDDILYAEGSGNYVLFVLSDKKIASRLTMREAEALLSAPAFIRIHRSFIVAKKHIRKMDRKSIWIQRTELPVGAVYLSKLENLIK